MRNEPPSKNIQGGGLPKIVAQAKIQEIQVIGVAQIILVNDKLHTTQALDDLPR